MTWLHVHRRDTPLILAFPHGGTDIPPPLLPDFRSRWWAIRDADWHIRALYDGLAEATLIWTGVSRSVIDCNRDPSGASLYPGQTTTTLCPTETFDGEPLYPADGPDEAEIDRRRRTYFEPYHAALSSEIARLRERHTRVVLYDAHSIRGVVPRLFDGPLPQFNIGTDGGRTCDGALAAAVHAACLASGHATILDGRFRGGWTTRHYGRPADGVHAIQMELAQRGYLEEPDRPDPGNWPTPLDRYPAVLPTLRHVLAACLGFAKGTA
jgi:formiminoglutamase